MRLLLTRTFEVITEDSAAEGDVADHDFEVQDEPTAVRDVIRELAACAELSTWPVRGPADLTGHEWATTEPVQDVHDGSWRSEAVHVRRLDGRPLSPRALFRLYRAAGLVR